MVIKKILQYKNINIFIWIFLKIMELLQFLQYKYNCKLDEVCKRNILGLGKETSKSRFMLTIINGSFRNTILISLLKVITKYWTHFKEHSKLYNNIINEFFKYNEKIDNIQILQIQMMKEL